MIVSIITATYNSGFTIEDCVTSVNNQKYSKIGHIIVDGASTDDTIAIVKSIPNKIIAVISESDDGIYDALNKGINSTSGDIIGFLHSDDIFSSEYIIQKVCDVFNTNSNIDGVYGDLELVDKKNSNKVIRKWKSQQFHSKLLNRGWMPAHPTLFLKKEVYLKHGLFDLSLKISADYDYMLRIFKDKGLNFIYLPEVITKMRLGGASNSSLKKLIQKSVEDYQSLKKNKIQNPFIVLALKKFSKLSQYL
jgi:glycosyltransferase